MFEFMHHLKKNPAITKRLELYENGFFPVAKDEITNSEISLGFMLPSELRHFYEEVGEGRLQTGRNGKVTDNNHVVSPHEIIEILNGTSEDWVTPGDTDEMEPDTLPFFIRYPSLFLCLHPQSDTPNAVWWMWGDKICDSLVEFFQKLVEDPDWFSPSKP